MTTLGGAYAYRGKKYLDEKGRAWKVVGATMLDGKVYLKLRRTWRPFSPRYRYAEARGGGAIAWIKDGEGP